MHMAGGRFLCALHPSMRAGWAPAWARLLKPGGELITLMFPLPLAPGTAADTAGGGEGGETKEEGPPWPLTPQLYRELLLPNGALLLSCSDIMRRRVGLDLASSQVTCPSVSRPVWMLLWSLVLQLSRNLRPPNGAWLVTAWPSGMPVMTAAGAALPADRPAARTYLQCAAMNKEHAANPSMCGSQGSRR